MESPVPELSTFGAVLRFALEIEAATAAFYDRASKELEPDGPAALARELAQGPTRAFGGAKRLFHQSTWESLETQMELEAQAIAASGHTEDFANGVTAFATKRTPTFLGR